MTHLLLGEFLAPPLLTYLMALIVSTRCTVTTIVLPLAPDAFTAPLSLLLHLLVLHITAANFMFRRLRMHHTTTTTTTGLCWCTARCHAVMFETGRCARYGRHLARVHVHGGAITFGGTLQAGGADFPSLFLAVIAAGGGATAQFGPVQAVVEATTVVHQGVLELGRMETLHLIKHK